MLGTTRLPALLGLVAAVAALSACGSDEIGGQIPQTNADRLKHSLNQVRDDVENGQCDAASSGAQAFVDRVNDLPGETATVELKDALREAGERLQNLVREECPATGTTGLTGEQPTTGEETTTDTTTTDTTTTDTTTNDTTTTDTQPEENGNGGGGGSGGGGDTGGGSGGGGPGGGGDTGGGSGGGSEGGTGGTGGTRG
jgi:hypothetical protein